ncbi:MAG: type II toxin-antitoxin system Phd/YefM family antitoxin [Holophagales bacterium]|nr:type II toxin-antitoxin system Phd/YefM family antitoxin [Holophagales bacterium]
MTASQLRQNIYRALDQVLETGIPLEIERKGRILRILPVEPPSKLDNLKPREGFFRCDPDELVEMDWSGEWKP